VAYDDDCKPIGVGASSQYTKKESFTKGLPQPDWHYYLSKFV
jgi:hypothetical protein